MKTRQLLWVFLLLLGLARPAQAEGGDRVLVMSIEGAISPATNLYFQRALKIAAQEQAAALVVVLNTPGGQLDAAFEMTEAMRNSPTPVIVYVAPRGAMAGSAGMLLALAAHANVMAPETVIGAATPVDAEGGDLDAAMQAKVSNLIKAEIRSWASWRGEAAIALAEAAIDEALAVSAEEALEAGLTDAIAPSLADLLAQLDGRSVQVQGQPYTLHTARTFAEEIPPSLVETLLGLLVNPNLVFILLTLGVQAILLELSAPGGWAAGTLGALSLAVAAYGLGVLPVNWLGLGIMAVAFALFILDLKTAAHGVLTAAGIAAFIAGALVLFNSSNTPAYWRVSTPLVVSVGVALGASFGLIVGFAVRTLRQPGFDSLTVQPGQTARTVTPLNPRGQVRYQGQLWSAELEDWNGGPVAARQRVRVVRRQGLKLIVQAEEDETSRRGGEA